MEQQLKYQHGRRKRVLDRLQDQLKSKTKTTKDGIAELTDKDVKRIEKEIETLKSRI